MTNKLPLNRYERHFRNVLQYAPGMLGEDAVNFFLDRFEEKGWAGTTMQPWRRRSPKAKRNKGRALLVDTATLKRSIRIIQSSGGIVKIGTGVSYAKAHNEGFRGVVSVKAHARKRYSQSKVGTGKFTKKGKERMQTVSKVSGKVEVKAHTRKINLPKRQFMGSSPYLTRILGRRLKAEMMKGLR